MSAIANAIRSMIQISPEEMETFLQATTKRTFVRREILSRPGVVPQEIFFIERGLLRVCVTDRKGTEHTIHFALENQFIADYAAFMQHSPAMSTLKALEATDVIVMPRSAIEWGYANLQQGEKLGRLIAEYYFIYHDERIRNRYARSPKERYDLIDQVFPGIQERVPQHMIASYLGITPVHLSRLKREAYKLKVPRRYNLR